MCARREPQQAEDASRKAAEDTGSADNIEKILEELDEELGEGEEGDEEQPDETGENGEEAQPGEAAEEKHTEL